MSVSERSRRVARRQGEVSAFTRQQALTALGSCATVAECVKWTEHANKHVRKAAKARIDRLENPPKIEEKSVSSDTSSSSDYIFAQLVEKFRKAGKTDPVKSARASVAASAQAAQRRAAAAAVS